MITFAPFLITEALQDEENASEHRQNDSYTQAQQGSRAGAGNSMDQWPRAPAARAPAPHAATDDTEVTAAAEAEGAALGALMIMMTTTLMLLDIATIVLCFGVGGGLVVSLWRSRRGKPVVRTKEEEIAHNVAMDALLNDIVRSTQRKWWT